MPTLEPLDPSIPAATRVPAMLDIDSVRLIAVVTIVDASGTPIANREATVAATDLPPGPVRDRFLEVARWILRAGKIAQ